MPRLVFLFHRHEVDRVGAIKVVGKLQWLELGASGAAWIPAANLLLSWHIYYVIVDVEGQYFMMEQALFRRKRRIAQTLRTNVSAVEYTGHAQEVGTSCNVLQNPRQVVVIVLTDRLPPPDPVITQMAVAQDLIRIVGGGEQAVVEFQMTG